MSMTEPTSDRREGVGRQILGALFPLGIAILLFFALLMWFAAQEPASTEAQNIAYGILGLAVFFVVTLLRAIVAVARILSRRARGLSQYDTPAGLSDNTSPPPPPPPSPTP